LKKIRTSVLIKIGKVKINFKLTHIDLNLTERGRKYVKILDVKYFCLEFRKKY